MENWSINGFIHSGITVKDMQTSLDFYVGILGFKVIRKQTNDKAYIYDLVNIPGLEKIELAFIEAPDGHVIELLEYIGADNYSAEARSCDYGAGHICFHVTNVEAMFQYLKEKGIQFKSNEVVTITHGNHKGSKAVYMKDPDGYLIELMERN